MVWQLVASYFTVKSTDIFYSVITFFSQTEILIALATKEKSYTDASITLQFRLMDLILLVGPKLGQFEIMHKPSMRL